MATIASIEGIGSTFAKKLEAGGIRSTGQLLTKGGSKRGRKTIADNTGISEKRILEWVNKADLMRIKGVGEEYSDLLEAAGVDTVKELRNRRPDNLHARCLEVAKAKKIVRRPPSASEVERWVTHAKTLDPAVTY